MSEQASGAESLTAQHAILLQLALAQLRPVSDLASALRPITEAAASHLAVDRASIWLDDDSHEFLHCADVFERASQRHASGEIAASARLARVATQVAEEPIPQSSASVRQRSLAPGSTLTLELPIRSGDKTLGVFRCELDGSAGNWSAAERQFAGSIAEIIALSLSAHQAKQTERELRASQELYRSVVEDQTDFILRAKAEGTIVFVNQAARTYFGAPSASPVGHRVFEFVPDADRQIITRNARRLSPKAPIVRYEHRTLSHDGSVATQVWVLRGFFDATGALSEYQAIGRDVTRPREQEARAREAQRLESLAVLSGGIAHDFNNLLTPILGYTEAVIHELPQDSRWVSRLQEVLKAGQRARQLVRQILIFSRKDTGLPMPVEVAPIIKETMSFMRASLPSNIAIELSIDSDCGMVVAQPSDIYQMLSNLCTNAFHAMPAGGTLSVSASRIVLDRGAECEPTLQIIVTDSGHGIEPEVREHIFEPFFTTKAIGEGTGLGLSVVHGTVTALGGTIDVQSRVGHGTSFVILLPSRSIMLTKLPGRGEVAAHLGAHVLVVDDEPSIAQLLGESLERLGYRVTARSTPNEALAALQRSPESFDLLITDLTMPHMTGIELAWKARRIRRGLPVLLTTGFGELLGKDDLKEAGIRGLLRKPFLHEELASSVREALDDAST